jgi:hypothetical protein
LKPPGSLLIADYRRIGSCARCTAALIVKDNYNTVGFVSRGRFLRSKVLCGPTI